MLSEQLNTEQFNAEEFIFRGMCDVHLAELCFHSAAELYYERTQVRPNQRRTTAQVIAAILDQVCQSFHDATAAHAPGMNPADLDHFVTRLREYLTPHATRLHDLLNTQSLSQLMSIKGYAEVLLEETIDESDARQLPVAELMAVAMSSKGSVVGQALDTLALLFGREVFIPPHANP